MKVLDLINIDNEFVIMVIAYKLTDDEIHYDEYLIYPNLKKTLMVCKNFEV